MTGKIPRKNTIVRDILDRISDKCYRQRKKRRDTDLDGVSHIRRYVPRAASSDGQGSFNCLTLSNQLDDDDEEEESDIALLAPPLNAKKMIPHCDKCDKNFRRQWNLRQHIISVHKEEKETNVSSSEYQSPDSKTDQIEEESIMKTEILDANPEKEQNINDPSSESPRSSSNSPDSVTNQMEDETIIKTELDFYPNEEKAESYIPEPHSTEIVQNEEEGSFNSYAVEDHEMIIKEEVLDEMEEQQEVLEPQSITELLEMHPNEEGSSSPFSTAVATEAQPQPSEPNHQDPEAQEKDSLWANFKYESPETKIQEPRNKEVAQKEPVEEPISSGSNKPEKVDVHPDLRVIMLSDGEEDEDEEDLNLENDVARKSDIPLTSQEASLEINPFKCEICKKSFAANKNFKIHFAMHVRKGHGDLKVVAGGRSETTKVKRSKYASKTDWKINYILKGKGDPDIDQINQILFNCGSKKRLKRVATSEENEEEPNKIVEKESVEEPISSGFDSEVPKESEISSTSQKASEPGNEPIKNKEKKLFECEICKKTLATKNSLKMHFAIHFRKRQQDGTVGGEISERSGKPKTKKCALNCRYCPEVFTSSRDLKIHCKIHDAGNDFCLLCGKYFRGGVYERDVHVEKEHPKFNQPKL